MASPLSAAGAYAAVARLTAGSPLAQVAAVDPKNSSSFSSVLQEAIGSVEAMGK